MKRSEINAVVRNASMAFKRHGWALPPNPRWDVTDFGLGDFSKCGLILINLAEQREYCEKVMYVGRRRLSPGIITSQRRKISSAAGENWRSSCRQKRKRSHCR